MTDSQSGHETQSDTSELRKQVVGLFGSQLKSFGIETTEHGLVLHGFCASFYTKQLVQEVVRKNSHLRIVLNAIVVEAPQANAATVDLFDSGFIASQAAFLPHNETETGETETGRSIQADTSISINEFNQTVQKVQYNPQSLPEMHTSNEAIENAKPFNNIFHPSDFSAASNVAFVHALKLALDGKAMLQMMHVDKHGMANWDDFPSVRETLIRWKVLPEGSGREAVEKLGVSVNKLIASCSDPVKACIDYFEIHDVDLIVLSVHQRDGVMRWLEGVVGERISQGAKQNTLFIPVGQSGFVSQVDGSVTLDHILIPIVKKPRGEAAVRFVKDLIANLNLSIR